MTHLFVERGEVAPTKVGRDLLSASGVSDIPAVDDVIAGFPCQDVSSLRRSKQLNASVVKDGQKRTGDMSDMCYCDDGETRARVCHSFVVVRVRAF